jgi:hypothetical protein
MTSWGSVSHLGFILYELLILRGLKSSRGVSVPKGYENYQLPDELAVYVKYLANRRLNGYTSEMEVVKDAVRRHIDALQDRKVLPILTDTDRKPRGGPIGCLSAPQMRD